MNHPTFARTPALLSALAAMVLASSPAFAQAIDPAKVSAAALAKYDANRNGQLDAAELAAMNADEARNASAAVVTGANNSEPVVQLSPFEVTDNSKGYQALSTMSGTRLNTKLEDLAASISVVTKQQLIDTAAIDINDVFLYEANTEGTGQFTAFSVGRNGDVNDSVQGSPMTANRIRGIDSANIARGNFASNSRIPVDSYNIDAVEISRGPNSNIFGLGNASGTVNLVPTRANLTRQISQLQVRGDSFGGYRSSIDLNRPLVKNKLGVRLSAVYDSKGFERQPAADMTHRIQGAFTFQPFKNTTIRGSYESYHNYARRPNALTPRDTTTYWNAIGRPTWDPVTSTAHASNGASLGTFTQAQDGILPLGFTAQGTGFYNRPSMYIDQGAVAFWMVNRTTTTNNANTPNTNLRFLESGTDIMRRRSTTMPLFTTPAITSKSLYDWETVNYVAPNYNQDKAAIYSVELEQFFFRTPLHYLAAQAGWYLEDTDSYNRNFIGGNSSVLYIDVNERLLDGRTNPYFLRPYLGASEPSTSSRPAINDNVRAQIAYQLDLSKTKNPLHWLGRHQFAGYGETRRLTAANYSFRDTVLDDHVWINTANRANSSAAGRAYFKYYLGDNQGQNIDYAPPALYGVSGRYNLNWFNGATSQWVSEPALFDSTGLAATRNRTEIRTRGLVTQSYLLDERIVATLGWRTDRQRTRDSNSGVVNPATGLLTYDALDTWRAWSEKEGATRTKGVVVRPFRWGFVERHADQGSGVVARVADVLRGLNVHYNTSDCFQPAATQNNLFGDLLPNPTGRGKDYGVSFTTLGGRLAVRINKYDTKQIKSRGGDAGTIANRANVTDFRQNGSNVNWNLFDFATGIVTQRFQTQGVTPTPAQLQTEVAKFMQLPEDFIANVQNKSIAETQDVNSKGLEIEVNYNPNRYWTLKLTAAQQKTIDDNLSPGIQRYFDQRLPVWTTIKDDAGSLWWTMGGDFGGPQAWYNSLVLTPYRLAIANQGKPKSQVREWRVNVTTSYQLAGLSENKWLKNTNVGGAVRWEDKSSIGFLGDADTDGVIRSLNKNKPVYDTARAYFDFFAAHNLRWNNNKIRMRVQLNVRNMFEGGRLQAIAVNPDGRPFNFRIIDPRQFILTTTFDL